jgi:hypothetical protein
MAHIVTYFTMLQPCNPNGDWVLSESQCACL